MFFLSINDPPPSSATPLKPKDTCFSQVYHIYGKISIFLPFCLRLSVSVSDYRRISLIFQLSARLSSREGRGL